MINNNLNINNLNTKETNIHHNDNGNHDNHDVNHNGDSHVSHDVNHNNTNDDNKNKFFLSILIPVYNYDCSKLVLQIFKQCNKANIKFEIILGPLFPNLEQYADTPFLLRYRANSVLPSCNSALIAIPIITGAA